MKLACPSCQQSLQVTEVDSGLNAEVNCEECGATVGVAITTTILGAGEPLSSHGGPKAVVAIVNPDLRAAYAAGLRDAGWTVKETGESRDTLQTLGHDVPDVAVVDGGFAPIFGMGLGEIIKKSNVTRGAKVLGLRPEDASNLPVPGADRTLSLVAGADQVVRAAAEMTGRIGSVSLDRTEPSETVSPAQAPVPAPQPAPIPEAPAATATPAAPAVPSGAHAAALRADTPDDPEHAAAQRLARIIVSDIALYNQAAIDEGIRNGNLREAMEPFLGEGRDHYVSRTSDEVRAEKDYFALALEQFVARKEALKTAAA